MPMPMRGYGFSCSLGPIRSCRSRRGDVDRVLDGDNDDVDDNDNAEVVLVWFPVMVFENLLVS